MNPLKCSRFHGVEINPDIQELTDEIREAIRRYYLLAVEANYGSNIPVGLSNEEEPIVFQGDHMTEAERKNVKNKIMQEVEPKIKRLMDTIKDCCKGR